MKRYLRYASCALLLVVLALCGGATYLLHYALQPERGSGGKAEADSTWASVMRDYPGLHEWHDSLLAAHALRDTMISATDGTQLHACYVRAQHPTRRVAVLVHGYTDNAVMMMPIGRMYHRDLGFNILLPDLRRAGLSGGTHIQMGWLDRLDVGKWVTLLPKLFGDSLQVVVHGVSMGAATTMMYSGEPLPKMVRAFVEDCGYTDVYSQFAKELQERFGLPAFPLMPLASAICRARYGWSFAEASALKQVRKCRLPMLFIHGEADRYVPTGMVYPLYEAKPQPKQLWIVPGAAHAASFHDHPAEYTRRVADFLSGTAGLPQTGH